MTNNSSAGPTSGGAPGVQRSPSLVKGAPAAIDLRKFGVKQSLWGTYRYMGYIARLAVAPSRCTTD
eukprot:CAMPEP_0119543690 /NCGR_PEP_ID=MMETSP1344-20130328/54276_1 /TAXON_ID=236787 /ORGANISM="Florenciella parvula, Strain CCMP2471" /LENGTH=65 /DNA_ID=CAMNT_0007588045 /DNA_START=121 /DNA_END=318 /DNA_ORIENTATION=-